MSWEVWAMTLRTSLFNFGIFKNIIKRFKWGSFLYFVMLFFTGPFILLVEDLERLIERYALTMDVTPVLLRGDLITFPMLLAVVVPTVVAVLIFNNVHSSKQSVFVHSLPSGRLAIYVSGILAGFVLMAAPVLLTAVVFMVMSFTAYGQIISSWSVVEWTAMNLIVLFVMFSVATFTAFLTGNTAAHIAINVFAHIIPMIAALIIFLISEIFLYGFVQSDNFIASELINNAPVVWLFGGAVNRFAGFNILAESQTWLYVLGAVAVYVLGFVVYKNRKIESCGDVAAFKVFKPILKYSVTTAAAAAIFGILSSMSISVLVVFAVAILLTAIVYFAAEMLLNKSFRVFRSAYKGYCGFAVFCAVFIAFFAYTGVFGYETRIPDSEDIEKASVYVTWSEGKPFVDDRSLIEDVREIHKEIISDIPVTQPDKYDGYLRISYVLNNGKIVDRAYRVSQQVYDNALSRMYENKEYKLKVTGIDNLNIENIDNLILGAYMGNFNYYISLNDDAKELMYAVKKDVEEGTYKEIGSDRYNLQLRLGVSCTVLENATKRIFKDAGYDENSEEAQHAIKSFDLTINPNFKNAYALLKEKGYYEEIISQTAACIAITKLPVSRADELYTYKGDVGEQGEFMIADADLARLGEADAKKLAKLLMETKIDGTIPQGTSYLIFTRSRNEGSNVWLGENIFAIGEADMPEYLKKYIQN